MQSGTDSDMARIVAAVAIAFVIVGTGLFYSVLDTLIIFDALHAGQPGATFGEWLPWFGLAGGPLSPTPQRGQHRGGGQHDAPAAGSGRGVVSVLGRAG